MEFPAVAGQALIAHAKDVTGSKLFLMVIPPCETGME